MSYLVEVLAVIPSTLHHDARVQHQQPHLPEIHFYFDSKIFPFFDIADVHGVWFDVAVFLEDGSVDFIEEGDVVVDKGEAHAVLVT